MRHRILGKWIVSEGKGFMKKTRDGRRRFSREFKIAAVRRVLEGEALGDVARDLGVTFQVLWGWKKRVAKKGEEHLYELGRPKQWHLSIKLCLRASELHFK